MLKFTLVFAILTSYCLAMETEKNNSQGICQEGHRLVTTEYKRETEYECQHGLRTHSKYIFKRFHFSEEVLAKFQLSLEKPEVSIKYKKDGSLMGFYSGENSLCNLKKYEKAKVNSSLYPGYQKRCDKILAQYFLVLLKLDKGHNQQVFDTSKPTLKGAMRDGELEKELEKELQLYDSALPSANKR